MHTLIVDQQLADGVQRTFKVITLTNGPSRSPWPSISPLASTSVCEHDTMNYSDKYDAYYCATCDIWTEKKCKDITCEFCATRPDKPSQIIPGMEE